MRAWLLVLAVLATVQPIIQVASTSEEFDTSSTISTFKSSLDNKQTSTTTLNSDNTHDKLKPDPSTIIEIEKNLLSLFGLNSKPRIIDRSKIVIPEAMKQLYAQIMGQELDTVNIPKPGLHTKSANTVRSFTHEGELL